MGQTPLTPGSVFSYFSPFYRVPNVTPPPVAPEFQALNAATALARANFAWLVPATASPAASQSTSRICRIWPIIRPTWWRPSTRRSSGARWIRTCASLLTTAASASTSLSSRVRSALYAAAASPQYQIQQ